METLPYLVPEFPEENLSPTSVVTPSPLVPPKPSALITPDKEVEPLRRGLAEAFEKSLVEEKPGIEDDDGYSPSPLPMSPENTKGVEVAVEEPAHIREEPVQDLPPSPPVHHAPDVVDPMEPPVIQPRDVSLDLGTSAPIPPGEDDETPVIEPMVGPMVQKHCPSEDEEIPFPDGSTVMMDMIAILPSEQQAGPADHDRLDQPTQPDDVVEPAKLHDVQGVGGDRVEAPASPIDIASPDLDELLDLEELLDGAMEEPPAPVVARIDQFAQKRASNPPGKRGRPKAKSAPKATAKATAKRKAKAAAKPKAKASPKGKSKAAEAKAKALPKQRASQADRAAASRYRISIDDIIPPMPAPPRVPHGDHGKCGNGSGESVERAEGARSSSSASASLPDASSLPPAAPEAHTGKKRPRAAASTLASAKAKKTKKETKEKTNKETDSNGELAAAPEGPNTEEKNKSKSFARRPMPKTEVALVKFMAIRDSFQEQVRPELVKFARFPGKFEDTWGSHAPKRPPHFGFEKVG